MEVPILLSERLILKPISENHISEIYLGWLNDSEVIKFLETEMPYNIENLQNYILDSKQKKNLFWGIHLKDSGLHIGNIKIDPINLRHGLGEYGILMGDRNEWGKGYAKEASLEVIKYCFQDLHLRKITLGVVEVNTTAFFLYKKLGFEVEGCFKNHGLYDGRYCNVLRMALFKDSFVI
jgi:RimJ/RimL family protein N-acetyltransferase